MSDIMFDLYEDGEDRVSDTDICEECGSSHLWIPDTGPRVCADCGHVEGKQA